MQATKDKLEAKIGLPDIEGLPLHGLRADQKCAVVEQRGEGAIVHFRIEPQEWTRLKRRMANQDPATFMWENHIHRMIDGAVY